MSAYKYIKLFLDRDGANGTVRGPNLSVENIEDIIAANALTSIPGPYTGDTEAASNGVPLNSLYRLSQVNDYDIKSPEGRTVIMRVVTILLLILSSFATVKAQFITNELIAELDTMQITDPGDFRSPWRYSRSEDQLYRWDYTTLTWEKTPGYYSNHIFLSQDGSNATGKLGRPDKPFLDPWGAQDSLSSETNLSFLAYQGNYEYTGPYNSANIQALTKTDTFRLYGLPGSSFKMLGATGNIRPFITDVTGSSTTPRYIYIDTPESTWNFTDNQSLSFPIGVYNDESEITFKARKFTQTGGRMLNSLGAAKYARIEIDSLYTSGGVAFALSHDFTTSGTDTITRDVSINLGEVYCGGATDVTSALRVQVGESGRGLVDTLSKISIKADRLRTPLTGGAMIWISDSSSLINSSVDISIGEYYSSAANEYFLSAKTGRSGQRQSQVKNSKINVSGGRVETSGKLIQLGWSDGSPDTLEVNGNSFFEINIGSAQISGTNAIYISKLILKDSAIVRINCEDCNFSQSPAIVIRKCDIPPGAKLIFSGRFSSNAPGELINIEGNNTDLSGLVFENTTFINDGVSEWIRASGATTITGASGLWSNSDSTVNTTIQGNKMWGFNRPIKTEVASNVSCVFGTILPVDVSGGTVEVDLPTGTPSKGNWFIVSDSRANSAANNITVDFITAGDNFQGAAANDVVATNGATVEYIYINSTIGWIRK